MSYLRKFRHLQGIYCQDAIYNLFRPRVIKTTWIMPGVQFFFGIFDRVGSYSLITIWMGSLSLNALNNKNFLFWCHTPVTLPALYWVWEVMQSEKISAPQYKIPDSAKKREKGSIWCPYCGEWCSFVQGPYGHKICPGCSISEADFWVKTVNNLWGFGVKPRGVKHDGDWASIFRWS